MPDVRRAKHSPRATFVAPLIAAEFSRSPRRSRATRSSSDLRLWGSAISACRTSLPRRAGPPRRPPIPAQRAGRTRQRGRSLAGADAARHTRGSRPQLPLPHRVGLARPARPEHLRAVPGHAKAPVRRGEPLAPHALTRGFRSPPGSGPAWTVCPSRRCRPPRRSWSGIWLSRRWTRRAVPRLLVRARAGTASEPAGIRGTRPHRLALDGPCAGAGQHGPRH